MAYLFVKLWHCVL
uniref:Uncharacterized protein n=1 Tax=Anguilla anguilla TaxID=7936 RepID=A0A0E9VIE2_ANGAN